jgi:hypothetical protein
MKNFFLGLFLTGLLPAAAAVGQTDIERPDPTRPIPDYRVPRLTDQLKELGRSPKTTQRSEPRVVTKGPLALSDQDRANYAGFLAQSDTGLIRLLPRINPKSAFAFSGERPAIRGEGAYYSFHYRAHEYGYGSDLGLEAVQHFKGSPGRMAELPPKYILSVGFAGADFGMMTNIGEVSLSDLTIADPRVAYMLGYKPPRPESEARAEYARFGKGVTVDGQTYKKSELLQVNATYLLRSINYGVSDVLVAFQVVRQEMDGSIILGWKLLKKYPTPELARNK